MGKHESKGLSLTGKVILVTGSSRGIGRAIAGMAANFGADVVLHGSTPSSPLSRTREEILRMGRRVEVVTADLADRDAPGRAAEAAWKAFGRLDALVNNAGISEYHHLFEATADDFDRLYHTNVRGSFLFTKDVAERMADRGEGGRVVTVTSVNGIRPGVGLWLYGSTKAALEVMMKGLAMELAPYRILVNTIAAGAVDTDMTRGAREDEELYRTVNEGIPLNRFARADEIAHFACALLADGASYATGTTITVDGGLLLMRGYGKPKRYER